MADFDRIEGGVTAAAGFVAAGVSAGIKKAAKKDVALIFSQSPATAAAVFTTNRMAAAPIAISKRHFTEGNLRAIVANSGNANACTGPEGVDDAISMARVAAGELGIDPHQVLVASTGVIGVPLDMVALETGIRDAATALGSDAGDGTDAAEAIMTTDTFAKQAAVEFDVGGAKVRVGGIAKGSGMIMPNMATMLAFVTTDAAVEKSFLQSSLKRAVDGSFNAITVDGETSTNDMVCVLANGQSGCEVIAEGAPGADDLSGALAAVCSELAKMIVRDGEGATKFIEVRVSGAASTGDAEAAARSIANSPLVKTALFAGDANWGRVAAAIGACGADLNPEKVSIHFGDIEVAAQGRGVDFDERAAAAYLANKEVVLGVDLGVGSASATVLTCDLSYEYVKINAEYRT